jgi:PAS domain S-box-containing protein
MDLFEMLLSEIDSKPILFVAAYREEEVAAQSYLKKLLDSLLTKGIKVRTLLLQDLPLDGVNRVIADTLNIDTATSMPLAHMVKEKTGGNPLFVRQFMLSLYDKGLVVFDEESHSWRWDADAIQKRTVIDSVAELMSEKIGELSDDTRNLMAIAACIGNSFSIKHLADIAELSVTDVTERLQPAVNVGLLNRVSISKSPYRKVEEGPDAGCEFPHDRVRQATYELLPQKQQRLNHLRIGRLLLSQTPENIIEECVFEIADQLNEGFEHLKDEEERHTLISLNLMAGRKARRSAAYLSSIRYLSMGIGLLPSDCWESYSETAVDIYIEAVESEYLSANYERAALLSQKVLQHTHDLFVRLRIYELQILFLAAQGQIQASVDAGLEALHELGIVLSDELPVNEQQELVALTGKIKSLERLPAMSDPRHLASLRIMMHLTAPALRMNLRLLETVIGKMVLLSVTHGNSPMAALAYGWYGALLCGNVGGVEAGYSFGKLSMEILRQFNAPELEPRVTLLFNAYVRHWKEPMRDSIFRLQEVYQWGLETGDLEYTSLGAVHHCGYLLFTGWPLEAVRRKQQRYLETLEWWRLPFQSELLRIWMQTAINLCDKEDDPSRLMGEVFNETKYVPKWIEEKNAISMFCLLCSRTMLQYLFGDYHAAAASGEAAEAYERSALGLFYRANYSFYYALSLLALNQQCGGDESQNHLNLALTHINRLRRWAVLAPMSFAHKLALVEAEQARARGENGRAIVLFNDALRFVRKYDNLMDEALICEREAAFYSTIGREDIAEISLQKALDNYRSWGAYCKVDELERRFKPLIHHESELIDTTAILKASHAISQEVHLEQLLEKMMRIVLENAGAEKAILIQKYEDGLILRARVIAGSVEILNAVPVDNKSEIALSVVHYVARTLSTVILTDAIRDPTFGVDEYIAQNQVRSLLCMPMIYQGQLSGLLYLENNLSSGVFTENRIEMLNALVSQAAISIENAGLYAELENNISALRKSEEKFRVVFDQTFQFIGVLDTEGTLLQANRSSLQFAGLSEDDVIGKPFWDTPWWTHSKELRQQLKDAVKDAVKGELVRFEATHYSPDGQVNYIDFSLKPVTDVDGKVVLLIPEGRNITELKQAEEEVLLMSFALDNVREEVFLIDTNARFRFVNEGACRALGYTREELLNMCVADIDPDWPAERWEEHWRELQIKRSMLFEGQHRTKEGRVFPVEISANYFQYGQHDFNLALARDITERKQAEYEVKRYRETLEDKVQQRTEDLRLARDAADTANKAKSTFLANMSHELRTPLNAILGFSHIMQQDKSVSASQRQTLDIINNSGEHLLKLINDVLEIAKIEAGKLELEIATFDLHALVREVSDMMQLRAEQKGLQLELDQSSEFPRYINGDEARVRQILVNLLSNAVKFTDKGMVTIRLSVKNNAHHHLLLEVEDSGVGISAEDQETLFKPFVQFPEGKSQGGTGLGLSIVQQFVKLMGGNIIVESALGKGSLFRVELPLDEAEEEDVSNLCEEGRGDVIGLVPGQPTYRILIAEDQYDNQLLLIKLMTDIGMEVMAANDGNECVRIFKEWKPDLIWMDRRMPMLDGVDATKRIRKLPKGDTVKIIAVTASAFKEQQDELMASKIDGFVSKPYRFNEIYDCLEKQLGLKFIYSDKSPEQKSLPTTLKPEMLAGVGAELRTALRNALDTLDRGHIEEVILQIGEKDRELAELLKGLCANFDYPSILNALEEAER